MSSFSLSAAIAHGVLSSSSAWAIWKTRNFLLAPLGFLLYFINGILGVITYGAVGLKVHKLHKTVLLVGLSLSLPIFSSQLFLEQDLASIRALNNATTDGMRISLYNSQTYFHLFFLLGIHLLPLLLQVTLFHSLAPGPFQAFYLVSLAYVSLMRSAYYGVSTTASLLIALYFIGPYGTVCSVPSNILFNYALSFSVYFLVQTFHGY